MASTLRTIVEQALGFPRTKELWTANYLPALPLTPQAFDIGGILPPMLYMARWGHRRGKGQFAESFGQTAEKKPKSPSIADVASRLIGNPDAGLSGFEQEQGQAVLGDLLLAYCLENRKHALGQVEPVQRVHATHYMASWIDLPQTLANLRGVPELLVSLLAHQQSGEWLEPGSKNGRFAVGVGFADNLLLRLFGRRMSIRGSKLSNQSSDVFAEDEAVDIGIDELLAVRLARACKRAPDAAKGKNESKNIPNRHPLASRAAECLREDLAVFIEVYGTRVPRQAFLQMLEAAISLGLTNLFFSTTGVLSAWEQAGKVPAPKEQIPWPLFVDCSNGQDKRLRELSEASVVECLRRYERLPVLMMLARVLDDRVRMDSKIGGSLPPAAPNAIPRIDLFGEIYHERHPRAAFILQGLHEDCLRLAEALQSADEAPAVVSRLRSGHGNAALRLAEALCELMGDAQQRQQFMKALGSALMTDQPNGMAVSRRVRRTAGGTTRTLEVRSIILSHPLLDSLVHRHLRKAAKGKPFRPLSLHEFLAILRERYGLFITEEPLGQPIAQELLLHNKAWLERHLRDMGLLIGVNDAETMKQLKPRYQGEVPDVAG